MTIPTTDYPDPGQRLTAFEHHPCDRRSRPSEPPCSPALHIAGTAAFAVGEDWGMSWRLDTARHFDEPLGFEVESVGGIETRFGGNLPLTGRMFEAIRAAIMDETPAS